jgi:hypothetical protein
MFTATACPGPYVQSRLQELADTVNSRLESTEQPKTEQKQDLRSFFLLTLT